MYKSDKEAIDAFVDFFKTNTLSTALTGKHTLNLQELFCLFLMDYNF